MAKEAIGEAKATDEVPEAGEEEDIADSQDIFYVCKKTLEALKAKLKANEEITQEIVNELTFPEKLNDDEIMVPVDMRGVGEDFDDVEQMVEKLGPKGTADAFIKAAEYFDANKDGEPEEERPKPMTAAEWKTRKKVRRRRRRLMSPKWTTRMRRLLSRPPRRPRQTEEPARSAAATLIAYQQRLAPPPWQEAMRLLSAWRERAPCGTWHHREIPPSSGVEGGLCHWHDVSVFAWRGWSV